MAFPSERSWVQIRSAVSADLSSIAKLHAASWRVAYRRIFSDAFLDGDLEADRMRRWMGLVGRLTPNDRLLIATHDMMRAAGFVSGWTSREMGCEQEFDLYIENLHVRPDMRGRKLGLALMQKLAENVQFEQARESLPLGSGRKRQRSPVLSPAWRPALRPPRHRIGRGGGWRN